METRERGAAFARFPEGATPPKTAKLSTAKKPSKTLRRQSSAFRRSGEIAPPTEHKTVELTDRDDENPVDYDHPFPSMAAFTNALALRYDANRTRHAYYRQLRLLHQHFGADPAALSQAQLRDYFLHVKLKKRWQPKTIRQAVAGPRLRSAGLRTCCIADFQIGRRVRHAEPLDYAPPTTSGESPHDAVPERRNSP